MLLAQYSIANEIYLKFCEKIISHIIFAGWNNVKFIAVVSSPDLTTLFLFSVNVEEEQITISGANALNSLQNLIIYKIFHFKCEEMQAIDRICRVDWVWVNFEFWELSWFKTNFMLSYNFF